MGLHKLTAGSGYDYLTRQVAALDATEKGQVGLAAYYTERGESRGVWVGSGLVGIDGLDAGDPVTAQQMRNLFGCGMHPRAEQRLQQVDSPNLALRDFEKVMRLGLPFRTSDSASSFQVEVAKRIADLNSHHAVVVPVRCHGQVVEIASADDWAQLCREFPLTVTASRRHDWFRTTGRDGAWVIPDWALVAQEWDAIHLPVSVYLEIAGRAIEVAKETASVIAGWDPDTSIWLAGAQPASAGAPQWWQRGGDDGWHLRKQPA